MLARGDRVIHLCEMKYASGEYLIDREYEATLRNKLSTFRQMTGTNQALFLTMVTPYGVKRNKYSGLIHSEVTLGDLFG